MKRIIQCLAILFSGTFLLASCLSDDNGVDFVYYDDTAITSFSLGTLNQYLHTLSSEGEDSVYKVEVTGSDYKFYIDQLKREIYNPDSLPVGTDAAHVICNVSSKNSGIVVIKNVDSDTLSYYNSTDSVDFSQPREFRVYSVGGAYYRAYKVSVNVHKEDPDSFRWNALPADARFIAMSGMKAVVANGKVMLFGTDGNATTVLSAETAGNGSWTALTPNVSLSADAYKSVTVKDNVLYTLNNGELISSADGQTWTTVMQNAAANGVAQLIGAGSRKLYAAGADGKPMSSDDNGATWTADNVSGDPANLPASYAGLASFALTTDKNSERIIFAGNPADDAFTSDSTAMVWSKIEEYAPGSTEHSWMECNEGNHYQLPRLSNLKITRYGDVMIAIGGSPLGTSTAKAFDKIYVSKDNGLTWLTNDSYVLPEEFTNGQSNVFAIAVDGDNCLWIVCGGNGQVWRGRLNKLGWAKNETSFTE